MASLKSFLPILGSHLHATPEALYERQRALMRLGTLDPGAGRGPGGGVRLNGDSMAVMLLSALTADNWSDVGANISQIAAGRPSGDLPPWLSKRTTAGALSEVLENDDIAARIQAVTLYREWQSLMIQWLEPKGEYHVTVFNGTTPTEPPIVTSGRIKGNTLQAIARSMKAHRFPSQTSLLRTEPFREVELSNRALRQKKGKGDRQ